MFKKLIFLVVLIFMSVPVFSQSVDTAWVRRYNTGGDDIAYVLTVYDSANVYVVGPHKTIKYDSQGNELWAKDWGGIDMTLDSSGHIYITGGYHTVKYYPNGDTVWRRTYNADHYAITVDLIGNVYVAGESYYNQGYAIIKYYPNGDTAWVRKYDASVDGADRAKDITVDGFGNVYVTGFSWGEVSCADYATIKYYPNGDTAWIRRYNGLGNWNDDPVAIAIDQSGNVYVTGTGNEGGTSLDYTTIKYYGNGDTVWVRRYDCSDNSIEEIADMTIDRAGNIYITGQSFIRLNGGGDMEFATVKYYPNGDTAWARRYDGPAYSSDVGRAIAVDGSGNVYVTGWSTGTEDDNNYATLKYLPNGDTAWVIRYGAPEECNIVMPYDIAIDDSGYVYMTGSCHNSVGDREYITMKYVQENTPFIRGDCNGDQEVTISDVIYLISYLFKSGLLPNPPEAGDANCDGELTISDIIYFINYLFKGGPPPGC